MTHFLSCLRILFSFMALFLSWKASKLYFSHIKSSTDQYFWRWCSCRAPSGCQTPRGRGWPVHTSPIGRRRPPPSSSSTYTSSEFPSIFRYSSNLCTPSQNLLYFQLERRSKILGWKGRRRSRCPRNSEGCTTPRGHFEWVFLLEEQNGKLPSEIGVFGQFGKLLNIRRFSSMCWPAGYSGFWRCEPRRWRLLWKEEYFVVLEDTLRCPLLLESKLIGMNHGKRAVTWGAVITTLCLDRVTWGIFWRSAS